MRRWTCRRAIRPSLSYFGTHSYHAMTSSMLQRWRNKIVVSNTVNCIIYINSALNIMKHMFNNKQTQYFIGMIKDCIWKGKRLSCSAIFTKQPTDRGMCCSFNKEKAEKMFQESPYRKQIEKLTDQDKTLSAEDSAVPDWQVLS